MDTKFKRHTEANNFGSWSLMDSLCNWQWHLGSFADCFFRLAIHFRFELVNTTCPNVCSFHRQCQLGCTFSISYSVCMHVFFYSCAFMSAHIWIKSQSDLINSKLKSMTGKMWNGILVEFFIIFYEFKAVQNESLSNWQFVLSPIIAFGF